MNGQPEVVIAIPTFNGERYVAAAIHSAQAQTYNRTKIFVVDDCSTDETFAVVSGFAPRVTVHRNTRHLGIGGNWNRCIELASGADYVFIAHQDDLYDATLIEHSVELLQRCPAASFALFPIEQFDQGGRVIRRDWPCPGWGQSRENSALPGVRLFEHLVETRLPMGPGVFRRSLCARLGGFDETFAYSLDLQFSLRMSLAADGVCLDGSVYRWRRHAGQATARLDKASRYAESIRAKLDGLAAAGRSGRFGPAEMARFRRAVARDCCTAARRYALGNPAYARHKLARALALCPASVMSENFFVALLRTVWSAAFGPTAAGLARAQFCERRGW